MRAVVQRVSASSVVIAGALKAAIGPGLLVLLAVEEADTGADIEWLSGKIVRLRIFNDEQGLMNRCVREVGGGILVVSQFTLLASTKRATALPSAVRPGPKRPFRCTNSSCAGWRRTSASPWRRGSSAPT